eukprot:Phypoly_transcript_12760.p1 GENE.Phypoly_transcript_12760~~Phypoly_transcript_12760.p1  ORF type:complete len:217 (+),score=11.92 Phypoly_transcript_12760:425-1075(+)
MMSFYPMGSALERTTGTLPFFYSIFLFDTTGSMIHFLLAYVLFNTDIYPGFYFSCSAGLSGAIFTILTIECHNNDGMRNFFGFSFPSRLYPWISLFIIQLLFGNVSFLGHLSGILVGYLYVYNLLDALIPINALNKLEGARWMGRIVCMDGYITNPNFRSLPVTNTPPSENSRWNLPGFNWFSSTPRAFPGPGRVLGSNLYITSPPTLEKGGSQPT